jgi:hypothetical protein
MGANEGKHRSEMVTRGGALVRGDSLRTVARKLTRFLGIARQHAAVALAAAALGGCGGSVPSAEAPVPTAQAESRQGPETVPVAEGGGHAMDCGDERTGAQQPRDEVRTTARRRDARSGLEGQIHAQVARRMPDHDAAVHGGVARAIVAEATRASLDPLLVLALIHVESSFDPHAVSSAGAVGLMQLLEPTMRREVARSRLPSADPRDPVANVRAGVRYLRRLVDAFGQMDVALMAYNAGPNRIRGHMRRGEIPERFYVYPQRVNSEVKRLRVALGADAARVAPLVARGERNPPSSG